MEKRTSETKDLDKNESLQMNKDSTENKETPGLDINDSFLDKDGDSEDSKDTTEIIETPGLDIDISILDRDGSTKKRKYMEDILDHDEDESSENSMDSTKMKETTDLDKKESLEKNKDWTENKDTQGLDKNESLEKNKDSTENKESTFPSRDSVPSSQGQKRKFILEDECEFKVPDKILVSGTSKSSVPQTASASTSAEELHDEIKANVADCLDKNNLSKVLIATSSTLQMLYSEPLKDEDDEEDKDYNIEEDEDYLDMEEGSDTSVEDDDDDDNPIVVDEHGPKDQAGVSKDISTDDKQHFQIEEEECLYLGEHQGDFHLVPKVKRIKRSERDHHAEKELVEADKGDYMEIDKTKPLEHEDDDDDHIIG